MVLEVKAMEIITEYFSAEPEPYDIKNNNTFDIYDMDGINVKIQYKNKNITEGKYIVKDVYIYVNNDLLDENKTDLIKEFINFFEVPITDDKLSEFYNTFKNTVKQHYSYSI